MKRLLFISLLFLVGISSNAQTYQWAFNVGETFDDVSNSIAADDSGNVYVIGSFQGTTDFDPSANIANLTPNGYGDVFVAKYAPNGNYLWAFNIGGPSTWVDGNEIAVDDNGNVYVTGEFELTADFDPSGNTANLTSNGNRDVFVAKYASNGNYQWAFNVGGTGIDIGYGIATDSAGSGNVYVTGYFADTADFDPSANTVNLTSNGGNSDVFVAKYASNGNYQWAFNVGGTSWDRGYSIATDPAGSGDVYVTGYFGNTADFDPSGNIANLTAIGIWGDLFIARYDANGNYLWAFNVGGVDIDEGHGITTDPAGSGDVYVTGTFQDIADFDPSGNTANLTSNGSYDVFVAKYASNGSYLWAFNVGGTGGDYARSITTGPAGSGDVYVTGYFQNTADFDPSANTANLTSNGGSDIFVARYDTTGNYLWAFNVGGTGWESGAGIVTNPAGSGDVYVCGYFRDTVDFDPSGNTANLTSNGSGDVFVAKYSQWPIGIDEHYNATSLTIYPNPTEGKFRVEGLEFGVETIEVYDLFGRLVLRTKETEIDMSSYPAGIYIWQIGSERGKLVLE